MIIIKTIKANEYSQFSTQINIFKNLKIFFLYQDNKLLFREKRQNDFKSEKIFRTE